MRLGPKATYLVTDPELVKPVLKMPEAQLSKGALIRKLEPIVGMSSLLLNGDEHRRRRGAVHRHLARGSAERLAPLMCAEIRSVCAGLAQAGQFVPHRVTAPLAIRLMCIALFGGQVLTAADEAVLVDAVNAVEDDIADTMFTFLPRLPWTAWKRETKRRAARRAMLLVVDRVRQRASSTNALRSLEALELSDADLSDEILMLLLAGHHTTGSTAAWLLYHLATEPGLLDAVAREADGAMDASGDLDIAQLKYCEVSAALVREVLRLYPAGWWFAREAQVPLELGGVKLKPGAAVIVCPWHLHHDPRFWRDPDTFSMDRDYGGAAYIPFGAGPRACVGMGVALLELQLMALEFAGSHVLHSLDPLPHRWPTAKVTLVPPPMRLSIAPRPGLEERPDDDLPAAWAAE